jgi:hypothetical protein
MTNEKPAEIEITSGLDRNRSRGIIGCAPRAWLNTKMMAATTATVSEPATRIAAKPAAPPSINP